MSRGSSPLDVLADSFDAALGCPDRDVQYHRAQFYGALSQVKQVFRANVGDSYNLLTQGESPTQLRGPSAQRIYDRCKEALRGL